MTTDTPDNWTPFGFGLNYGRPALKNGWGARALFKTRRPRPLEFVRGRSSHIGSDDVARKIVHRLNARIDELQARARELYLSGELDPTTQGDDNTRLIDTDELIVEANTNGSHGYLYIAAWVPGDELG
jgi:hypothetical protein